MIQNAQIGDFSWKFSKANVRFESSTFKIEYRQNFVKIWKLIRFGPKCPNLCIWAGKFCWKIRKLIFLAQNTKFGRLGSEFEKRKLVRNSRFPNFESFGSFWLVSHFFCGSFRLVLGRFGWFRAGFGSFWLVPGISKYGYAIVFFEKNFCY